MQSNEVSVAQAVAEAPAVAAELAAMAQAHRNEHHEVDQSHTQRAWVSTARTYCYQTHIAISAQPRARLAWLAELLYSAARLQRQPWYPQFSSGCSEAVSMAPAAGIGKHQLSWGCFDLGLPQPRYYRQLVSLASIDDNTQVIVARSVPDGPALPAQARLAYTLNPNGEVVYWENDQLHWHHICCTPGAGLLTPLADRLLINTLRLLRLDQTERATYREEAGQMRDWLHSGRAAADISAQISLPVTSD
jgi:hypothetical protein